MRKLKATRAIGGIGIACTLLGGLVALGDPAQAATAAPLVVTGTITTSSGAGASGSKVYLVVSPSNDQIDALPENGSASETVVGTATTATNGGFNAYADDMADVATAADADGTVNFTVMSVAPSGDASTTAFSDTYDPNSGTLAPDASGDSAATPGPTTISATQKPMSHGGPVSRIASAASPQAVAGLTCGIYSKTSLGNKAASIGRIFSTATSGVSVSVGLHRGAHTSLGVGVSASGDKGTFSASGSNKVAKSKSKTSDEDFGLSNGFKIAANTYYRYVRYYHLCASDSGTTVISQWEVHPTSYQGPLHPANMSSLPSYGSCYVTPVKYHLNLAGDTAQKMETGVDIHDVIGIDLSSQSGYNSTTVFDINTTKAVKFCGTTGRASSEAGPGELVILNA